MNDDLTREAEHERRASPYDKIGVAAGGDKPVPNESQVQGTAIATATHIALDKLSTVRAREAFLRDRLRLPHPTPTPPVLWFGLAVVTIFAAVARLWRLGHPTSLVFDETYYVKDAYSLLHQGYAGTWNENPNDAFAAGDTSYLQEKAAFVVHPDVGKWLIAIGIRLFGVDSSFGWRITIAIAGIISVWLIGRIAARLFRSVTVAVTAAALLAMDGIHLVETRIALLDGFLMLFVLFGFWALLRDRDDSRARLARRIAEDPSRLNDPWGPALWWRPWLVVAGVFLGLATGVKWSGLYMLAAAGLAALAWDIAARRAVGARLWIGAGVFRGGLPAFVNLVPVAGLVYLASWFSWFTSSSSYYRTWAQGLRDGGNDVPRGWLPDVLNNLWEYHAAMYRFHVSLHSDHSYQSNPFGWLIQLRPTSFFWETSPGENCGLSSGECAQAITALGNPAIWWPAALGLLVVLWAAIARRDWRAWAILVGYFGLYVPWLIFSDRTIFTFYTIAFVPFVCLTWVFALGYLTGHVRHLPPLPYAREDGTIVQPWAPGVITPSYAVPELAGPVVLEEIAREEAAEIDGSAPGERPYDEPPPRRLMRSARITWGVAVGIVGLVFVFFYPIWTAMEVPKWFWRAHMWLGSMWI